LTIKLTSHSIRCSASFCYSPGDPTHDSNCPSPHVTSHI
jgi:hypothetical protein